MRLGLGFGFNRGYGGGGGGPAVAPFSIYDPTTDPQVVAYYDWTDPATNTPTQALDGSMYGNHATKLGNVTYEASNALSGGRGAAIWPSGTSSTNDGFQLPGLTIGELFVLTTYDDGVDNTFDGNNTLLSGVSLANGEPRLIGPAGSSGWGGSGVITSTSNTDGKVTEQGSRSYEQYILPLLYSCLRFKFPSALTETSWRLGADNSASNRHWFGPMNFAMLFDRPQTAGRRRAQEAFANAEFGKNIPVPSWGVTDRGRIIEKPVGMPTRGPYYTWVQSMSEVPDFPFDYACMFSTDHDTTGGLYMYLCNGDPSVAANWVSYDTALANGDFDYLGSKPAGNPIYIDTTAGDSTETPCFLVIGGEVVLFYQQSGVGYGQGTVRALSTDGVNFTRDGLCMDFTPSGAQGPGGGHTGYLRAGRNIFEGIPYQYVAFSLLSDGVSGYSAVWGCNNPKTDMWQLHAIVQKTCGRALGDLNAGYIYSWNNCDPGSAKYLGDGVYSMLMRIGGATAGAGVAAARIYEVYVDSTAVNIVRKPQLVVDTGASGTYNDEYVQTPTIIQHGGKDYIIFTSDDGTDHHVGIGECEYHLKPELQALSPAVPAGLTNLSVSFKTLGALPNWLEVVKAGTTDPTESFDSDGIKLSVTTGSTDGESYIFHQDGVVLDGLDYLEVIFDDVFTTSAADRIIRFGLATSKSVLSAATDALFYTNLSGTTSGYTTRRNSVVGGVASTSDARHDIGSGNADARGHKYLGFRWFAETNRIYMIGESGQEVTASFEPAFSLATTVYPFIGIEAHNGPVTECIGSMSVKTA